jgi:RNA polymerase sigma-70 factor (ECF subfamily)
MTIDATAAAEYLLRLTPRLRAYLRVLLGPNDEAEDLLQELFLRFLRAGPTPGTPDADRWVFRVSRNLALNAVRSRHRRRKREAGRECSISNLPDPAELAERNDDAAKIQQCLDRLDASVRELIYLKIVEGLTFRDLEERTGIPRSTAVLRLQEGLADLARCFEGW